VEEKKTGRGRKKERYMRKRKTGSQRVTLAKKKRSTCDKSQGQRSEVRRTSTKTRHAIKPEKRGRKRRG